MYRTTKRHDLIYSHNNKKQHMKITIIENNQISLTSFNKKNLHISFIISTFAIEKTRAKVKLWSMVSSGYKKYLLKYV